MTGRLAVALAAVAVTVAPASALAADSVVGFDGSPAVAGQSANTIYAAAPGLVFGPSPRPAVGSIPSLTGCGVYVAATPAAPSQPNAGSLACGGGEFPTSPALYGTFTTATRTRIALRVGDPRATGHTVQLTAYDGDGLVVGTSAPTAVPAGGVTLSVMGGQPEIASFLLSETGNDTAGGLWVDDIAVDDPPVPGHPAFSLQRTGSGTTYLTQGGPLTTVDLSLYRINGSDGNVDYATSGLPDGVVASQVPSVNGVGLALSASPEAAVTSGPDVTVTVTATPHDAGAGTRAQTLTFPVRVAPALLLSARGVGSAPVPSCSPILLDYGIADFAGPASWTVSGLPSGVTASINGTPIGSAPTVSGYGTAALRFSATTGVTGRPSVRIGLVGSTYFGTTLPAHRGRFADSQAIALDQASGLTVSPTAGRTPRELGPGTAVTLTGDDLCTGPAVRMRFGNDQALAPIVAQSRDGRSLTAIVPRNATTGPISLVPDAASPAAHRRSGLHGRQLPEHRRLRVPQLRPPPHHGAGGDGVRLRPDAPDDRPVPGLRLPHHHPDPGPVDDDPARRRQRHHGQERRRGRLLGFSRTSQQLRRGDHALGDFSPSGARNAFALDGPNGPAGPVQEYINSGQLSLLSNEYIPFYLTHATANAFGATPTTIRNEITGYLRGGDDPQISLRDGGSLTKMHVVIAYDIEQDPNSSNAGDYYIDVYDSNKQFLTSGTGDETTADGMNHAGALGASRIHVRADGFWELPSSNLSASSLGNLVVSGYDNPPRHPSELTLGGLARQGLVLLLGSDVARFLPRATAAGATAGRATVASSTEQISAGGRTLFTRPGVLNTNPKTALHATPWVPPTGGTSDTEGYILGAGANADYTVRLSSKATTAETRTILGPGFLGQISTTLHRGVSDELTVQPGQRSVGISSPGAPSPVDAQLVVRAPDGSTRTVATSSPSSTGDTLSFPGGASTFRLVHQGPAATVGVTLSWVGRAGPPQAVSSRVRVAADSTLQLTPSSWARLRGSADPGRRRAHQ